VSMVHHSKGDFSRPDPTPKLIPKIFHQTYMTSSVPPAVQPLMESWRIQNPDWNFRFYDDEACLDFVGREFPEYLDAYKGLPKNVERSDFFRYALPAASMRHCEQMCHNLFHPSILHLPAKS
jgi:mannosyltransferase OCH1-like enzyme